MAQTGRRVLGWHFIDITRRLGNGDGRLVVDGETLSVRGPIKLCWNGLHLSERVTDALWYGRLPIVCRVIGSGACDRESDKAAYRHRRCLWSADATPVLARFTAWCTERSKYPVPSSVYERASFAPDGASAAYVAVYASDRATIAADNYAVERDAQNTWLTAALNELAVELGVVQALTSQDV